MPIRSRSHQETADQLRGHEFDAVWVDEIVQERTQEQNPALEFARELLANHAVAQHVDWYAVLNSRGAWEENLERARDLLTRRRSTSAEPTQGPSIPEMWSRHIANQIQADRVVSRTTASTGNLTWDPNREITFRVEPPTPPPPSMARPSRFSDRSIARPTMEFRPLEGDPEPPR